MCTPRSIDASSDEEKMSLERAVKVAYDLWVSRNRVKNVKLCLDSYISRHQSPNSPIEDMISYITSNRLPIDWGSCESQPRNTCEHFTGIPRNRGPLQPNQCLGRKNRHCRCPKYDFGLQRWRNIHCMDAASNSMMVGKTGQGTRFPTACRYAPPPRYVDIKSNHHSSC